MSSNLNSVLVSGYLGQDPELKFTHGGQALLTFSVGTTERYKANGQWRDLTTWVRCVVWGPRGENLSQHLSKGSFVVVRGSLSSRSWEDRDGNKRTSTDVKVHEVDLGPRLQHNDARAEETFDDYPGETRASQSEAHDYGPDDIPF